MVIENAMIANQVMIFSFFYFLTLAKSKNRVFLDWTELKKEVKLYLK